MRSINLGAGDRLFIAGASGAIGTLVIQMAAARGIKVAASASEKNHAYMQSLGAEKTVDYRDPDWPQQVRDWSQGGVEAVSYTHLDVYKRQGLDCFRVLDDHRVAYMALISSGNETSAHTLEHGRITFMFCSLTDKPDILRLYGKGSTVLPGSDAWGLYAKDFTIYPSTRQIIVAEIDLVQSS